VNKIINIKNAQKRKRLKQMWLRWKLMKLPQMKFFVQVIVFDKKKKLSSNIKKKSINILQKNINYALEQSIVVVVEVIDDVVITSNDLACYTKAKLDNNAWLGILVHHIK